MRAMTPADYLELATVAVCQGALSPYTWAVLLLGAVIAGLIDRIRPHQEKAPMPDQPTAPATRTFHLGDLLSVTTGRLVSPDAVGGIYAVCDFVTGQAHFTHQLPRAMDVVGPVLVEQLPFLADIEAPEFGGEAEVWTWLAAQVDRHGERHTVTQMPFGAYVGREPMAELEEMVGKDRVVPVVVPHDPT